MQEIITHIIIAICVIWALWLSYRKLWGKKARCGCGEYMNCDSGCGEKKRSDPCGSCSLYETCSSSNKI